MTSNNTTQACVTAIDELQRASALCAQAQQRLADITLSNQTAAMIDDALEMTACAADFIQLDIDKERITVRGHATK